MSAFAYFNSSEETLSRPQLLALQRQKLRRLLGHVFASNQFYHHKAFAVPFDPERDELSKLPFTTRPELEQDQIHHPPFGSNLSAARHLYRRMHQTSGSTGGNPMRWLDTDENWEWCKKCWKTVFAAAGLTADDRIFFPFSFGPFLGFWAGFSAAESLGNLIMAGGGMSSTARLKLIREAEATVLCCTPTYALRLAEVAENERIDLSQCKVRLIVVAGEPGGSIPEVRGRIAAAWNARVFDHWGMTEIGPLGFECPANPGNVHLMESECIAEVIDPRTGAPILDESPGELVITNLGRVDSPVIRYRTGDLVRLRRGACACGRSFALALGGIAGRIDDMIHVRGNNIYPGALEAAIASTDHVAEFRIEAYDLGPLTELLIEVEPTPAAAQDPGLAMRVARIVQDTFSLRAEVRLVAPGALPRSEMKSRRFSRRKIQAVE